MHEWLHMALEPALIRPALVCVVSVGAVLIIINHVDAIIRCEVTTGVGSLECD